MHIKSKTFGLNNFPSRLGLSASSQGLSEEACYLIFSIAENNKRAYPEHVSAFMPFRF